MNEIKIRRRILNDLLRIKTQVDFHRYLIFDALKQYESFCESCNTGLGSALVICADAKESLVFPEFKFDHVTLSSIVPADETTRQLIATDNRFSWAIHNAEALTYPSRSYDLVFCKEGLHHLARPVLGVYEMLRVCRRTVIFIEPYRTIAGNVLERIGLGSVYETNQHRNLHFRDNYVFRFNLSLMDSLLNSYYLRSGYKLDLGLGWLSGKVNSHPNKWVRTAGTIMGWLLSFIPGSRGNYMTALVIPGADVPLDPLPAEHVI